jgi:carboxyl-terminal processing protease
MLRRILPAKRCLILSMTLLALLCTSFGGLAEPVPGKQDRMVVQMVTEYLRRAHLMQPKIDDDLSKRLFSSFFKNLDPMKLYFMKSDVEDFRSYETELDDMLIQGDMSFAYKGYERYMQRLTQRQKLIEELVNAKHDFTVKEYLDVDYDKMDFASTEDELRDRWRKRIKFELLQQRLGTKPEPEDKAKEKILARYKTLLRLRKQMDNFDLMEQYLSDLTTSVDPHSSYMSPNTLDDFDISMRLNLEGIGALLRQENGQTIIAEIVPGGAAAADGRLKPNDKITAVAQGDGKYVDIADMKLREVVKLIRGPRGTKVQLKVTPTGKIESLVYDLTRQKIELKDQAARYEIIEDGKKADGTPYRIGVLDLPSFYSDMGRAGTGDGRSATDDVRRLLKEMKAKGIDGLVLDLRRNGGGSLTEACSLTGLFIDRGPIVQVKGSNGKVSRKDDPDRGIVYGGPMMVLVSKLSASASEILAGALQDYDRALIVGDSTTHGKGTVQAVIDLGNQLRDDNPPKLGALKLTIQQFYRVNGDSTQNRGVASDVVLPSLTEHLGIAEKELDHALPFDRVPAVSHEDMHLVNENLKATLRIKSAERIKESKDFAKLQKEIDLLKARKERKKVPLNEQELKEQFSKEDADKADQKGDDLLPPDPPADGKPYKFARNFANNEVLAVMTDYLREKK